MGKKRPLHLRRRKSAQQIKMRAQRISEVSDSLLLMCETDLGAIQEVIEEQKPDVCVIDSIQTMFSENVASAPGSVSPGAGIYGEFFLCLPRDWEFRFSL